jgi:hypothetical protein
MAGNYPENREDEQAHINNRGDILVSQGLPETADLARMGDSWQVKTTTGVATIIVLPTTTPGLCLWNGEPTGIMGKCYIIDSVCADVRIADGAQASMLSVYCMLNKPPIAAPTDLALPIASSVGKTYGGRARTFITSVTDNGWFPVGNSVITSPTAAGAVWKSTDVYLGGLYIVPPGSAFSVQAVQVAPGALNCFFTIRWHEVQLIWKS